MVGENSSSRSPFPYIAVLPADGSPKKKVPFLLGPTPPLASGLDRVGGILLIPDGWPQGGIGGKEAPIVSGFCLPIVRLMKPVSGVEVALLPTIGG